MILVLLVFITTRPITVIFHELGHALPALLLSKEKVEIYIGSYGNSKKSFHFRLKRLEVYFKYSPFLWNHGLCVPKDALLSKTKRLIIFVGGPMTSMLLGALGVLLLYEITFHPIGKAILSFFIFSSILDFIINIVPSSRQINLDDGRICYNDGQQIIEIITNQYFPKDRVLAIELFNENNFDKAQELFNSLLDRGQKTREIYQLSIASSCQLKAYQKAIDTYKLYESKYKLTTKEVSHLALLHNYIYDNHTAIKLYHKAINSDPGYRNALANRGYTFMQLNQFSKAIEDFNSCMSINSKDSYALANRGLAYYYLGNQKAAFSDLNKAMELDPKESYVYLNFGIWYLETKDYTNSLVNLEKARMLNPESYQIDERIKQVKKLIQSSHLE